VSAIDHWFTEREPTDAERARPGFTSWWVSVVAPACEREETASNLRWWGVNEASKDGKRVICTRRTVHPLTDPEKLLHEWTYWGIP
jgi:hypothetical protein